MCPCVPGANGGRPISGRYDASSQLDAAGDDRQRWLPIAQRLLAEGLLGVRQGRYHLTQSGRAVQDAVTVALLP